MFTSIAFVVIGLALLSYASDQFVIGAARVALILRVAPLVVGVVVVGFGTSAPEMLVSSLAAARGELEVSVGNAVGSNLANLTLILGVGALLCPMLVDSKVVSREAPYVVAATVLLAIFLQGGINRIEATILLVAMAAALFSVMRGSRGTTDPIGDETVELTDPSHHSIGVESLRTLLGLAGTVAGAQLLLTGALDIADRAGLGEGFVGATLVALGTSLPELVTVVQAARRSETELIVGNLLGSNLFNALAVMGLAGLVGPGPLDDAENLTIVGIGAALVVALAAWRMMSTGHLVSRREGTVLLVAYVVTIPLLL